METQVEIRKATAVDSEGVAAVYLESRKVLVPFAPLAHTDAEVRDWITNHLIPNTDVRVAVLNGDIVGMCGTDKQDGVEWIDHLYLKPKFVGRGIGTILLKDALGRLGRPVRLYTFQPNAGAIRFYERHGFRPIKYGDGSGNEEGVPDVLMALA